MPDAIEYPVAHRNEPLRQELQLSSLGLAIILVGQPIAWSVRGIAGGGDNPVYPAVAVIFGLMLVARPAILRAARLYVPAPLLAVFVLLWLLPLGAMSLVAPVDVGVDGAYAVFLAGLAVAVAMTPIESFRQLPLMVTIVGGISSILPLGNLLLNGPGESFLRLTLSGSNNTAIAGTVGGVTMMAALLVVQSTRRGGIAVGLLCTVAFVAGAACVALSNTRSVMLMLAICLPLIVVVLAPRLRRAGLQAAEGGAGRRQRLLFWAVLAGSLITAPVAATAVLGTKAITSVVSLFTERLNGAFGVFESGGVRSVDLSSQLRVGVLDYTWRRLDFLGHGISEQIRSGFGYYPHLTFLQAFYDFGLAGGMLYLVLALLLPLALIWLRLRNAPLDFAAAFAICLFLYELGDQFSHGTPYGWSGLLPALLVYVIMGRVFMGAAMRHGAPVPSGRI